MKKRTVITTEKREVWVVREGLPNPGPVSLPETITVSTEDETEEPEAEHSEKNTEP
jgi:hypothetical protein